MLSCWRMCFCIAAISSMLPDLSAVAWRSLLHDTAPSRRAALVTTRALARLLLSETVKEQPSQLSQQQRGHKFNGSALQIPASADPSEPEIVGTQTWQEVENTDPLPPPRSYDRAGYRAPEHLRKWAPFTYATPEARRAAVRQWVYEQREAGTTREQELQAAMKVILIGGPASGKGTISMMLSQAFRLRVIGVGSLLRAEVRSGTRRGRQAAAAMARGDLLDDNLVLNALHDCLDCWDVELNGWLLDGFPRKSSQVEAVLSDEQWSSLRPDVVIYLERPDELTKEFMMGRMTDTATGQTYHPIYAPPPPEIHHRIVWRLDDVPEVAEERIRRHREAVVPILDAYTAANVPIAKVNNARSEIETFSEIATFIDKVRAEKIAAASPLSVEDIYTGEDVEELCSIDSEECIVEYESYTEAGNSAQLLEAVRRCNSYDLEDYVPVVVGQMQVGWASHDMVGRLRAFQGTMCRFTYLDAPSSGLKLDGVPNLEEDGLRRKATLAVQLAPLEEIPERRTEVVAELVRSLVSDGVIAAKSLRHELQDVRPLDVGFVGPDGPPPLLQMERAAMIYFGVPSYGVHINGYVRDPENPSNPQPHSVWIATRSLSKATYPGLLDQVVAGGQPSSISLLENVRKECEEEASFPPEVVEDVRVTGLVSYRYATRKGLSTKRLVTFDVEIPRHISPLCADGEVEEFNLVPVGEMLDSIRYRLPLWKPNSALVAIDFAMRHGLISADEPGYTQMAQKLRL